MSESEDIPKEPKVPSLYHNYVSFLGTVIAAGSIVGITLLFLLELTGQATQPYLGIFTYIMLPGVMMFGMAVVALGMFRERRRRRDMTPEEILAFPVLDLNDPRRRRAMLGFLVASVMFLFISAFGSYKAFEFSESVQFCGQVCHEVMKPEFVANRVAPHSKIACVECHVESGADGFIKAKMGGVRQLFAVTLGTFDRPIKTPVHNMADTKQTCSHCHWQEKFYGEKLRIFNHYGYDEASSLNQTRMLINIGGGTPETGAVVGSHWHTNMGSEVAYVASDERREVIPWVRVKDEKGNVTEYFARGADVTPEFISSREKRVMNCIDCHNRPTHIYLSPNEAVDQALSIGKLDLSLPFIKAKSVEVLAGQYMTNSEALEAIANGIDQFYKTSYPAIYASRKASVDSTVVELQRIYQTYFFPEMKTDWRAHPNNIGHYNAQGCFRCHDGQHFSREGKVIRNDCTLCHKTLDQTFGGKTLMPADGQFKHPVNLGDKNTYQCNACHTGDRTFKHPLNLGDISAFSCVECHKGDTYKMR
jgi:hypothetical protein